jgi:hypothetical protein
MLNGTLLQQSLHKLALATLPHTQSLNIAICVTFMQPYVDRALLEECRFIRIAQWTTCQVHQV